MTVDSFPILDEQPVFPKTKGRAKTPVRIAMETLPEGKSIIAGIMDGDDSSNLRKIGSVRSKVQEVTRELGFKFSVRVDVDDQIIVTRRLVSVK